MSSTLNLLRSKAYDVSSAPQTNDLDASGAARAIAPAPRVLAPADSVRAAPARDPLDIAELLCPADPPQSLDAEDETRARVGAPAREEPIEDRAAHDDGVRLAAKLRAMLGDDERTLLFTGAGREGAADRVASETARALARMKIGDVALVDLNAPAARASSDFASSSDHADLFAEVIAPRGLHVITANLASCSGDAAGGASPAVEAGHMLNDLRRRFRYVVVSCPPLLDSADAALLAAEADGAIIVLTRGRDSRDDLARTKQELDGLRCRALGVVLCEEPRRSPLRRSRRRAR